MEMRASPLIVPGEVPPPTPPLSTSTTGPCRDETFYFDMTVFEVEGCLFKVPRRAFEEQSDIFRSMFSLPPERNVQVEGMSDERPLILEGVTQKDFRAFLKVLFPPSFGELIILNEIEWLSVLHLAHMWGFMKIRQASIEQLQNDKTDLITRIELAHRYDIREWLFTSYVELGKRPEPISVDEAKRLGYEFAIKMAQVREMLYKDKIDHPGAYRRLNSNSNNGNSSGNPFGPGSRGDSPRGGTSSASAAQRQQHSARMRPSFTFPPGLELEDADDLVLERAIGEVFGIRGEPHPEVQYQRTRLYFNQTELGQEEMIPNLFNGSFM